MIENKVLCEMGIIGLGVMGNNLLLNMADHGFIVAGYDTDLKKVNNLKQVSQKHTVHNTTDIKTFIGLLRRPRAILLLVPAGSIVDSVIQDLLPHLEKGDLIIDAGNSYFKDTDRRITNLKSKGFEFMGVGISGGEEGARHGPSIMPGGSLEAYHRIRLVLEAIAAKADNTPCVTYLGPGSCGHFVKMVHNGIEYGIMQLIAETYDLMKRGLHLEDDQLRDLYSEWNKGDLNSYLIEITSKIFDKIDDKTGKKLINTILDMAAQNGTGMWTTQSAMELQVPVPTIDVAVTQRDLSVFVKERLAISAIYQKPTSHFHHNQQSFISDLHQALFASILIVFIQGMALLKQASNKYEYNLDLEAIATIWRGGCIIRSKLLEDIRSAFHKQPNLSNLLLDIHLSEKLMANQIGLRKTILQAIELGIPVPGFMSTLAYLDAYRSPWLPANLIQAQRDYFGSHRYERNDIKGSFHTEWEEK
jgi:6-phosphogluconate dehydrogenase